MPEYLRRGASVTVGHVFSPVWTLMFVLAVARVTPFNFAMILNQMFQVPHGKTWTLDQRKCELFKSFFLNFQAPSVPEWRVNFFSVCCAPSIYIFVCDWCISISWLIHTMNECTMGQCVAAWDFFGRVGGDLSFCLWNSPTQPYMFMNECLRFASCGNPFKDERFL